MNKIDLGTTEFLRLVELLEVENPSFQQTENVLIQAEHHTANDKLKLYVKLGENELLRLESEGFEISEDKEMFQRVMQSVSLANEHSLKEYGFGYYDLSPQIQDEYLEDLINDQLIEYRSSTSHNFVYLSTLQIKVICVQVDATLHKSCWWRCIDRESNDESSGIKYIYIV